MLTFHWAELLVIIVGGLVLFLALAFLVLRRRNEVLQDFLTPDEPNLEEEFFRVRSVRPEKTPEEEPAEEEPSEAVEESNEDAVQWGKSEPTA